jgi:hypothetical protein
VVFFAGCTDVTVTDVTMRNQPAGWSYWIHDCDRVRFDRCTILADVRYPNNDGIHLNCSRDVTISNCIIESGDDSIVLRANSRSLKENKALERVTITNCVFRSWSAAIRLGWSNGGVIRDCNLSNIVIYDSSKGVSIDLPEYKFRNPEDASNDYGREATLIENISFSNTEKLGGLHATNNTNWTMAALFAGTSGLPFGFPVDQNSMNKYTEFAPDITAMGDILKRDGYVSEFLCGSDAAYGGRALYFREHGAYEIYDLFKA